MSVCERQRRRIQPGLLAESTAHWSPIKTLAALQVRLRFETTCHRASRDYGSYTICKPLLQWGARLNAGQRIICGISKRRAVPLRNRPYCWVYLLQRFRTDRWGLNFSGFKWFAGNQGVRHLGWRRDLRSLSPSSVSQHPSPPLCPNTPALLFGNHIRLFHPGVNLIQRIYTLKWTNTGLRLRLIPWRRGWVTGGRYKNGSTCSVFVLGEAAWGLTGLSWINYI